ncbi:MAG: hypothetical protein ACYTG0_40275, partial [Planctomycetota bacterium]
HPSSRRSYPHYVAPISASPATRGLPGVLLSPGRRECLPDKAVEKLDEALPNVKISSAYGGYVDEDLRNELMDVLQLP